MDKLGQLREYVQKHLCESVVINPIRGEGLSLQIPYRDSDGDPIKVAIYFNHDLVLLSDAGRISGHLFALGQHTQDTPAFKLLRNLAKAYRLKLDYDSGRVVSTVSYDRMDQAITDFIKVIITMLTAIPHVRVEPHRLKPLGQRLRTAIREQYRLANIVDLIEHDYILHGQAVDSWPVDFHWWLRRNDVVEQIYIVAVDLNVAEALSKATKVTALALDARRLNDDHLRVVVDSHGADSDSSVAIALMKNHSEQLRFKIYDFGQADEKQAFLRQSVSEIVGELGGPWREFWQKQRALT